MSEINENKDILIEINLSEAPLFNFAKVQKTYLIEEVLNNGKVTTEAKGVLDYLKKQNNTSRVDYRKWIDSNGNSRELIITSSGAFPNAYCMDVFFGLVRLLIKKNSPLEADEDGRYKFKSNKVEFSMNELCEAMEIKNGGNTNEKIVNALRTLKLTSYFSIDSIYNKEIKGYERKGEKAISLIESYNTSKLIPSENGVNTLHHGDVIFGDLIMTNLELGFARVVRNHQYFKLTSGITRGIYTYLESNRTKTTIYLKRSLEVLRDKIPVEYKYPSDFKNKVKKPLARLIESGVISDYFYADEYVVNGNKENCIYFIFKGTKTSVIKQLEEEYAKKHPQIQPKSSKDKKKDELEDELELVFPEDIKQELESFGLNLKAITDLMSKHSKYKLAEYILWMKDAISKEKVKDPAGLFMFAMSGMVDVSRTHGYIVEFVERYKSEVEGKKKITEDEIRKHYNEYIDVELKKFEEEEDFVYTSVVESLIGEIESVIEARVKSQRQLYNMAETKEEKDKILKTIEKWEKFNTEREKSEIFVEMFIKKVSLYRGLKLYEDFRRDFIAENR